MFDGCNNCNECAACGSNHKAEIERLMTLIEIRTSSWLDTCEDSIDLNQKIAELSVALGKEKDVTEKLRAVVEAAKGLHRVSREFSNDWEYEARGEGYYQWEDKFNLALDALEGKDV